MGARGVPMWRKRTQRHRGHRGPQRRACCIARVERDKHSLRFCLWKQRGPGVGWRWICVFDLRDEGDGGVWAVGSGAEFWNHAVFVAKDFVEFCRARTAIGDVYGQA